ncbi:serine acetyltransferase, partial [Escherichia coli]|nr:serine acetyltransferase [Escherichia coli]EER1182307.1 serine acetyltransferase [Escherichia coli]
GDMPGSRVKIGSNVDIGANCCIIGLSRKIGDNVKIGAMSFINKDIPSNCTYITKKSGVVLYK